MRNRVAKIRANNMPRLRDHILHHNQRLGRRVSKTNLQLEEDKERNNAGKKGRGKQPRTTYQIGERWWNPLHELRFM